MGVFALAWLIVKIITALAIVAGCLFICLSIIGEITLALEIRAAKKFSAEIAAMIPPHR